MTNVSSGSKRAWDGIDHHGSVSKRARDRDDSARDWRDVHLRSPNSRKPPPNRREVSDRRDGSDRRHRGEYRPRSRSRDRDYRRSNDRERRDYRDREPERDRDYHSRREDSRKDDNYRHSPPIRDPIPSGSINGIHRSPKEESEKEEGE